MILHAIGKPDCVENSRFITISADAAPGGLRSAKAERVETNLSAFSVRPSGGTRQAR
jgi:hypothetical protein